MVERNAKIPIFSPRQLEARMLSRQYGKINNNTHDLFLGRYLVSKIYVSAFPSGCTRRTRWERKQTQRPTGLLLVGPLSQYERPLVLWDFNLVYRVVVHYALVPPLELLFRVNDPSLVLGVLLLYAGAHPMTLLPIVNTKPQQVGSAVMATCVHETPRCENQIHV